jgi:hypothetical protein
MAVLVTGQAIKVKRAPVIGGLPDDHCERLLGGGEFTRHEKARSRGYFAHILHANLLI